MAQAVKLDRTHTGRFDELRILSLSEIVELERVSQHIVLLPKIAPFLRESQLMIVERRWE